MLRFSLLFMIIFASGALCRRLPKNPCPDVFRYENHRGTIVGVVSVPNDKSNTLKLGVTISMRGYPKNPKMKIKLITPQEKIPKSAYLKYKIDFPMQNPIPKIKHITFNDKDVCVGSSVPVTAAGVTNLWVSVSNTVNQKAPEDMEYYYDGTI